MDEKGKLFNSLEKSYEYYDRISPKFQALSNSKSKLDFTIRSSRHNKASGFCVFLIVLICVFFILILPRIIFSKLGNFLQGTSPALMIMPTLLMYGVPCFLSVLIIWINKAHRTRVFNRLCANLELDIERLSNEIFNHYNAFFDSGYQVLPYIYCEPQIIYQFLFYLQSCRADTLKEAINCFVTDVNMSVINHNQMLTLSAAQQAALNARKAKNMATVGAVASVLSNL